MALLTTDKELAKKIGLTAAHEMDVEDKRQYVEAQINGIKAQLWRSRVDAILNHNVKADNKAEEIKVAEKIEAHETDARRYTEAITLLSQLLEEL